LLDIRVATLKYVRFLDLKQLENDKLFELIAAIENSLSLTDRSLHSPVLPVHHQSPSIPMMKTNQLTLNSTNILPVHYHQPIETKSTGIKLEKQSISSSSSSALW
jgi:hypothetical protein